MTGNTFFAQLCMHCSQRPETTSGNTPDHFDQMTRTHTS